MSPVRLKRAYDPLSPNDGVHVLVDFICPRGLMHDIEDRPLAEEVATGRKNLNCRADLPVILGRSNIAS